MKGRTGPGLRFQLPYWPAGGCSTCPHHGCGGRREPSTQELLAKLSVDTLERALPDHVALGYKLLNPTEPQG